MNRNKLAKFGDDIISITAHKLSDMASKFDDVISP